MAVYVLHVDVTVGAKTDSKAEVLIDRRLHGYAERYAVACVNELGKRLFRLSLRVRVHAGSLTKARNRVCAAFSFEKQIKDAVFVAACKVTDEESVLAEIPEETEPFTLDDYRRSKRHAG